MAKVTLPEFDSSSIDTLRMRLDEISGLASCSAALSDAICGDCCPDRVTLLPADDALPMLGLVMRRLAGEAKDAADALWQTHEELRNLVKISQEGQPSDGAVLRQIKPSHGGAAGPDRPSASPV